MSALHFRVARESRLYDWPRVLCGARGVRRTGGWGHTRELRTDVVVACPMCMVIKDAWLDMSPRRPLTIRRARTFLKGIGFRVHP